MKLDRLLNEISHLTATYPGIQVRLTTKFQNPVYMQVHQGKLCLNSELGQEAGYIVKKCANLADRTSRLESFLGLLRRMLASQGNLEVHVGVDLAPVDRLEFYAEFGELFLGINTRQKETDPVAQIFWQPR